MAKYGLEAVNRDKHAAKGGIERERLEALVEAGLSIGQIAAAVGLSKSAVRHWLSRYRLCTKHGRAGEASDWARAGKDAGLIKIVMSCPHHGETEFLLEGRGYYRCKRCRSEAVSRRRLRIKQILVAEAGGKCSVCGYSRNVAALHFHHLEPSEKVIPLSAWGMSYSLDTLRAEARKCVLLCSNCHAEVENGGSTVSIH